jgi:predicted HTH domain antitoxin
MEIRMKLETLEIKIPKEILLQVRKEELIKEIKFLIAMDMYDRGILSLSKAALLAEMTKEEFMEILSEYGVDIIKYPKEELEEELENLKEAK